MNKDGGAGGGRAEAGRACACSSTRVAFSQVVRLYTPLPSWHCVIPPVMHRSDRASIAAPPSSPKSGAPPDGVGSVRITRYTSAVAPGRGAARCRRRKDRLYSNYREHDARERHTQIDELETHAHRVCRSRATQPALLRPRSPSPASLPRPTAGAGDTTTKEAQTAAKTGTRGAYADEPETHAHRVCRSRSTQSALLRPRSPSPASLPTGRRRHPLLPALSFFSSCWRR